MVRASLCAGLAACLLIACLPTTGALQLQTAPVPPLGGWTPMAAMGGHMKGHLAIDAIDLGDVDLDGYADIALRVPAVDGGAFQALAGPDLTRVLWSLPLDADVRATADIDGDGALDLQASAWQGSGEATGVGVAATSSSDLTGELRVLSGRTGAQIALAETAAKVESTWAQASDLQASATQSALDQAAGAGAGTMAVLREQVRHAGGWSSMLPLPGASSTDVDAVLELQGLDGTARASVAIEGPDVDPWTLTPVRLKEGATAATDIVALTAEKVSQADQMPLVRNTVQVISGVDGEVAWSVEFPAFPGYAWLTPQVGDVDLDGTAEVAYSQLRSSAEGALMEWTGKVTILGGEAGKVAFEASEAGHALFALALTAAEPATAAAGAVVVQAEGVADAATSTALAASPSLLVGSHDLASGELALQALGSDFKTTWEATLPAGSFPVNGVIDAVSGSLSGFTDLTGDGIGDIAASVQGKSGLEVRVLSGLTGELAYTVALEGALEAAIAGDGANAQLAIVRAPGGIDAHAMVGADASKATSVLVTLLDAGTGVPLWEAPLATAEALAALPEGVRVHGHIDSLGDVDADGVPELAASLLLHAAEHGGALLQAHVFSGSSGSSLMATERAVGEVVLQMPLDAAPQVVPLSGYAPTGEAALNQSPLGFWIPLVAALAAIVLARRR